MILTWGDFPVSIPSRELVKRLAKVTPLRATPIALAILLFVPGIAWTQQPNPLAIPADAKRPAEIPAWDPVPALRTIPIAKDHPSYNYQMVDTALLPRDRQGLWVLDFAFKPLRIRTVEAQKNGKTTRKQILYLYYKVTNHTGEPRMFIPQFIIENETGQRFEDEVIPEAIPLIRAREDQSVPVLGAVNIMGVLPTSKKPDVDDAVYGVATWEHWDRKSDRFKIYVRGLSDGYKETPNPEGGKPSVKYKTLRIDYLRRGDALNINEKEFQLADPPYEWVYW
jgi:hypothetical protein